MENKKITSLTLREVYELESEISGLVMEGKVLVEGIINQKISIVTKYHMNKLVGMLREEKKMVDEFKNELIKKYGKENEDGSFVIEPFVVITDSEDKEGAEQQTEKRVQNPAFLSFSEEYTKLLNQVKDVEHHNFDINEFSKIETTDNYNVFFKLFD
jgi:hypothetical protein